LRAIIQHELCALAVATPPVHLETMTSASSTFDFDFVFDPDDYLYFLADTLASERTEYQVDQLEKALAMTPPMRVIDLGCGHGRHANELARRGYRVVGIDLVAGFLDRAARAAAEAGLNVEYKKGDMAMVEEHEHFDRAVCLFDAFGFFDDAHNLATLRAIARSLVPGGRFCLDLRNRDWIVRTIQPTTVMERGSDLMIDRHQFDVQTGRLVDRRAFVRDGRVRETTFSVRLYSLTEIRALLDLAGVFVRDVWGNWDGAPLTMQHNRMVLMCEKRS
jgi:SAM-dependent methyltransferase